MNSLARRCSFVSSVDSSRLWESWFGLASMAVSQKQLFIRTEKSLFCIDQMLAGEPFGFLITLTDMQVHEKINRRGLEAGKHVWSVSPKPPENALRSHPHSSGRS